MQNKNFTTALLVDQTPTEAFHAILNVRDWWYGLFDESFEGSSSQPGEEFSFRAGGGAHYSKQKMTELVPDKKVAWLVTESTLTFVDHTDEWVGTELHFDLSREQDKTKIVFTHVGLVPEMECYQSCAPAWTQYIQERLKLALTTQYEQQ